MLGQVGNDDETSYRRDKHFLNDKDTSMSV